MIKDKSGTIILLINDETLESVSKKDIAGANLVYKYGELAGYHIFKNRFGKTGLTTQDELDFFINEAINWAQYDDIKKEETADLISEQTMEDFQKKKYETIKDNLSNNFYRITTNGTEFFIEKKVQRGIFKRRDVWKNATYYGFSCPFPIVYRTDNLTQARILKDNIVSEAASKIMGRWVVE